MYCGFSFVLKSASDRRTDAVFSMLGDDPTSCSWSNLVLSVHYLKFWSSF